MFSAIHIKLCFVFNIMTKVNDESKDDILKQIFQLQKDYTSLLKLDRYPKKQDERISVLCTAIIHETIELQRLTSWKWWKTRYHILGSLSWIQFSSGSARQRI